MTSKEEFVQYLYLSDQYKSSTIYTYGQSIELISSDIRKNIDSSFESLFKITDKNVLKDYFQKLYCIPEIIKEEEIQGQRKTNAFKRYIEFCEKIDKTNFNTNQPDIEGIFESKTEGGKKVIISTIAERDPGLRASAIKIHGTSCFGCGFNFEEKYGNSGNGFIEIHHIKPLSSFESSKKVDPHTELMPLCSNCHRIVHRKRDYVLSLQELKNIIKG